MISSSVPRILSVLGQVARNVTAVLVAVLASYLALAVATTIDQAIGYPRDWSTAAGAMFLQLTMVLPFIAAAVSLGAVAASIARPARLTSWLLAVFILAAGQYAVAIRYADPAWHDWLKETAVAYVIGAAAVGAFWLVARRIGTAGVSGTADSPSGAAIESSQ
jgi:hypothetical protein